MTPLRHALALVALALPGGCAVAGLAAGGLVSALSGAPPAANGPQQIAPFDSGTLAQEIARLADDTMRRPVSATCTADLEEESEDTEEAAPPRCRMRSVCLPGAAVPTQLLLCQDP